MYITGTIVILVYTEYTYTSFEELTIAYKLCTYRNLDYTIELERDNRLKG